jgi:hypothetical protein
MRRSAAIPITFVLDQGVPRDAAGRLRDFGYKCVHIGEVGMSTAADEEILRFALAIERRHRDA